MDAITDLLALETTIHKSSLAKSHKQIKDTTTIDDIKLIPTSYHNVKSYQQDWMQRKLFKWERWIVVLNTRWKLFV